MTQQGMNTKKKNLHQRLQTMKLMMGTKSVNPKEKTTWGNATLWKNIETRWRSKVANINGAIFNNKAFAKTLLENIIEALVHPMALVGVYDFKCAHI
jgi:hypothetical protein